MCSVVGYIGKRLSKDFILEGLSRLEYRGYDSAGFACLNPQDNRLLYHKSQGRLQNLTDKIAQQPVDGFVSIGHTRWSTHGAPTEGNAHPRVYGTFPRILGDYVKERKLVSLEEGIRKMTGLPASILGLTNRGLIKEGYKADVVIFDPETIIDKATYENPCQYPEGIDYVIVNGDITVTRGQHLGILNGRILKYKKSS